MRESAAGSLTTLNTGLPAARRITIAGKSGKISLRNQGMTVIWYAKDADLVAATGADGSVGPGYEKIVDIGDAAFVSLWSTSDLVVVYHSEVA